MLQNRYVWAGAIILVLLVANIINWIFSGWGLITVTVHEVPLAKVIKSIEWQGHVTIYTDIDPTTPVSMYVVKVPLAEAMESLAVNVTGPDGRGGAQWKLGFFVAPSSSQVKQEIRSFQAGATDDDTKIYSYQTPLQMLASDSDMPAADPRLQTWPGYKAPPAPPPPNPADNQQDGDANAAPPAPPPPPPDPTTVQDYLQALARQSDIWIMTPGSWEPNVSAPAPSPSIIRAVKNLVSSARGSVTQAIILRARGQGGRGGPGRGGGRGFAGGDTGWSTMEDRMRNAINGLPVDARPAALDQLTKEVAFQQQVRAAPRDQRRAMMRQHMMDHMGANDWRRSPEKRAQMYARVVSNRQAARGQ
jgi:hypothetical protein